MTADLRASVQKAVYDVLTSDADIISQLPNGAGDIYDFIPDASTFPYCQITLLDHRAMNTKTHLGAQITVQISVFSDAKGSAQIQNISDSVVSALDDADLTLDNHDVIDCRFQNADFSRFEGGASAHIKPNF